MRKTKEMMDATHKRHEKTQIDPVELGETDAEAHENVVCARCKGDGLIWHRMNSVFIDCPDCCP